MEPPVEARASLNLLLRAKSQNVIEIDQQSGQIKAPDLKDATAGAQHQEAVVAFAKLITEAHGSVAGEVAWGRLETHLQGNGTPLSVREATSVVEESLRWKTNLEAFEDHALRHVLPMCHDDARQILRKEMRQNLDAGTSVLKDADFTSMFKAVEEDLKALQDVVTTLPSRADVVAWAGAAKDSKFFGKGYQEILEHLVLCSQAVDDMQRWWNAGTDVTHLMTHFNRCLTDLEDSLRKYCSVQSHTRRPEMEALLAHLIKLKERLQTGQKQPAAAGMAAPKVVPAQPDTAQNQLPDELDLDKLKRGEPILLGAGLFNQVKLLWYELLGEMCQGVFKPTKTNLPSHEGHLIGIDPLQPHWSERNVASYRLATALGLNVIPRTNFAKLSVEQGDEKSVERSEGKRVERSMGKRAGRSVGKSAKESVEKIVEHGVIMDLAKGYSPFSTGMVNIPLTDAQYKVLDKNPTVAPALAQAQGFKTATLKGKTLVFDPGLDKRDKLESIVAINFNDKVLQRELTNLNWFDLLAGQVDRHGHNFFVEEDANRNVIGVKGIDNDACFGKNTTDPALAGKLRGLKGTDLPGAISKATYDKLMGLTPKRLRALMKGLDDAEIEAAIKRLTIIQDALGKYEGERVLTDDQWGTDNSAQLLGIPKDLDSMTNHFARNAAFRAAMYASYVARHAAIQQMPDTPVLHLDQIQAQLKQIA